MKITYLISMNREELEEDIREAERHLAVLKEELESRREDDSFGWGFMNQGNWILWDSYDEAIQNAVTHYGDDGAYRVVKVYKTK